MTRAEEKALEIFPVKRVPNYGLTCNAYSERDANLDKRALFCMGYEQAEKDIASIIADLFGYPCNYSPIDEEMVLTGNCEELCGSDKETAAKCWQRYFDLKRKK